MLESSFTFKISGGNDTIYYAKKIKKHYIVMWKDTKGIDCVKYKTFEIEELLNTGSWVLQ